MNTVTSKKKSIFSRISIDHYLIICILACLVTASMAFGMFIIRGHGAFTLISDFNAQQLTFNAAMQTAIKERGFGEWFWNLDLGCSFINGFSFYTLGSVFCWLGLIFPKAWFPYVVGELYILKYVVAGITAYMYLKLFIDDRRYCVIGALLYAFSGFQTTNLMFYHFHDVVAMFPLLLIGLERVLRSEGHGLFFIFSVFVCCLLNYYFFIEEVVFLVIYFLARVCGRCSLRQSALLTLRCCLCGIMGVGMAAVLFIPNIIYILESNRSNSTVYLSKLIYDCRNTLFILKGMLLPGDVMHSHSAVMSGHYNSTAIYIPFVGMSLALAYVIKSRRDWLKFLIIIFTAISFSPLLQSGFIGFTEGNQRWWFMFSLMLSLASVKVMQAPGEYDIRRCVIIMAVIIAVFYILLKFVPWSAEEQIVYHNLRFLAGAVISIGGLVVYLAINSKFLHAFNDLLGKRITAFSKVGIGKYCIWLSSKDTDYADSGKCMLIFLMVMCFSCLTTAFVLHFYSQGQNHEDLVNRYYLGTELPNIKDQFRYSITDNMLTLPGDAAGIACFNSTIENSAHEFDSLFDLSRQERNEGRADILGLPQLLAGKYTVSKSDEIADNTRMTISVNGTMYRVDETKACPIGFAVDKYILRDDLMAADVEDRAAILMNACVVYPDDVSSVSGFGSELDTGSLEFEAGHDAYIDRTVADSVSGFHRDSSGFSCTYAGDDDRLLYFTVPYDKGWSVSVDGLSEQVINSCGMMVLPVTAGNHEIVFTYHTPWLRLGMAVSVVSWIAYLSLAVFLRVKNSKR